MQSSERSTHLQAHPTVSDCTERELIHRIRQRLAPQPAWLQVGIGDDAAVVEVERNRLEVLSVDAIVEGVHFDRTLMPPAAIGHRALAVNLSDLAAMGATPRLALLSMALPETLALGDFDGIADGLTALAARTSTVIVGGNLTRTPGPLTIDVTVVGTVKPRRVLTRSGARTGDELYVTGSLGAARAGLEMLRATHQTHETDAGCVARYERPTPRLRIGGLLARNRIASACVDLSDGLADGVREIAASSRVGVTLDAGTLPIETGARDWFASQGRDVIMEALSGGDDYELMFAVRPRLRRRLESLTRYFDVPIARIGVCTAEAGTLLVRSAGTGSDVRPLPSGYGHFR
ncbi:MAG TPA: thiamine-phosphate kinase [Vicinamibacterales bacterium]